MTRPQNFHIRTYGCQMNVHDSDKLANLLHHSGLKRADQTDEADLLVINTCSIRDKAENHLYSDLGKLGIWKQEKPGRLLGVGGCVAQQVGDNLLKRFPQVDFVFGTHNLRWVPAMVDAASDGPTQSSQTTVFATLCLQRRAKHVLDPCILNGVYYACRCPTASRNTDHARC